MKRMILLCVTAGALISGCSTTRIVERDDAARWGPEAVERLSHKTVHVHMLEGGIRSGEVVTVDSARLMLQEEDDDTASVLRLDGVLSIHSPSNAGPVLVGIIGGALAGGLIGFALAPEPDRSDSPGDALVDALLIEPVRIGTAIAIGAGVGSVVGGVGIGLATKRTDYTLVEPEKSPTPPAR